MAFKQWSNTLWDTRKTSTMSVIRIHILCFWKSQQLKYGACACMCTWLGVCVKVNGAAEDWNDRRYASYSIIYFCMYALLLIAFISWTLYLVDVTSSRYTVAGPQLLLVVLLRFCASETIQPQMKHLNYFSHSCDWQSHASQSYHCCCNPCESHLRCSGYHFWWPGL